GRTLVDGVVPLEPGHYGIWRAGSWQSTRFWQADFRNHASDGVVSAGRVRDALQDSVTNHLVSDVPVALSLSGGLDSGAVLALSGQQLPTLTIGFSDTAFDESGRAGQIAGRFGSPHCRLRLDRVVARRWLP